MIPNNSIIEFVGPPGSGKSTLSRNMERECRTAPRPITCSTAKLQTITQTLGGESRLTSLAYRALCHIKPLRHVLVDTLKPAKAWSTLADNEDGLHDIITWVHQNLAELEGNRGQIARRLELLHLACLDIVYLYQTHPRDQIILFDESLTQSILSLSLHHPNPAHFIDQYLGLRTQTTTGAPSIIICKSSRATTQHRLQARTTHGHDHHQRLEEYMNATQHLSTRLEHYGIHATVYTSDEPDPTPCNLLRATHTR